MAREAVNLARSRSDDVSEKVARTLADLRAIEDLSRQHAGLELNGVKILDIGAGQLLLQMTYFAVRRNEVVGIDQDVIVRGFSIPGYLSMLRANGPKRVLKTLGRKALLVDARYERELARQLQVEKLPRLKALQMDAASMTFADGSFDFVYAFALEEIGRVLRPGGALYFDFILYTSRGGSHDVRLLGGQDGAVPDWAHLREEYAPIVRPNAYLNRIRLPDWLNLFEEHLPGAYIDLKQPEAEPLEPQVRALWEAGELTDYSLDELLTTKVAVLWRKPR
jgi:SAM-dependent methyltransferase